MNYRLLRLGIGDIFLFCLEVRINKYSKLKIKLQKSTLTYYRSSTPNYGDFCKTLIRTLLPDVEIEFFSYGDFITYEENWDKILESLKTEEILNFYKKLFNEDVDINEEYFVLFTKIRDYNYSDFSNVKTHLFDLLNKKNVKILLLGEREVEYGVEYKKVGENNIYSIYNDIINGINKELIIDKTLPKLGITLPSIEKIKTDMSLIYNSKKTIMIGRGGFFCLSLLTNKLISLHNKDYVNPLKKLINKNLFMDTFNFLNQIDNE